jgi:DNA-directed RNA polymerase specialized sigma24 family protein
MDATISEKIQEPAGQRPPASQNGRVWGLTSETFDKLLLCLDADRDRAGYKYESTRRKLVKYFECRGCKSAEDLADETINRVARKISDGCEIWTSDPASYFYGVARYVLKEYWSSPDRDFSPYECLPTKAHPAGKPASIDALQSERTMESRLKALDHCIKGLSVVDRETLLQYYQGEKGEKIRNRQTLARQLEMPLNALRIKVHRIRKRLEAEVNEYLQQQL